MKFILVTMFTMFVSACSTEASGHHVLGAVEFCKDHGGVSRLWSDFRSWHTQCMDGERKRFVGEKDQK